MLFRTVCVAPYIYHSFDHVCHYDLQKVLPNHWLAGFIEAENSFYILNTGQHGFAIGQAYDVYVIAAIHRLFNVQAKLKIRSNYVMLDTKNKQCLLRIAKSINKKVYGLKSFTFSVWLRCLRKNVKKKSLKARQILQAFVKRQC